MNTTASVVYDRNDVQSKASDTPPRFTLDLDQPGIETHIIPAKSATKTRKATAERKVY